MTALISVGKTAGLTAVMGPLPTVVPIMPTLEIFFQALQLPASCLGSYLSWGLLPELPFASACAWRTTEVPGWVSSGPLTSTPSPPILWHHPRTVATTRWNTVQTCPLHTPQPHRHQYSALHLLLTLEIQGNNPPEQNMCQSVTFPGINASTQK